MTALSINMPFSFFRFESTSQPKVRLTDEDRQELRREALTHMISSGACASELGAQALMSLYPKEF